MLDGSKPISEQDSSAAQTSPENKDFLDPNRKRTEGYVIECNSRKATIIAPVDPNVEYMENYWAVGQQISIWVGENRVIGQSYKVESADAHWADGKRNDVLVHLELIGEVSKGSKGDKFSTGISHFPQMGCVAHRIRTTDLSAIYENSADQIINIGHLSQDNKVDAKVDVDKLLTRHFAVVGSTGVGKSTSVTLMLRKVVEARKDVRVLILDPHNEFSSAFAHSAMVINSKDLQLPFWMFDLDEISEVFFRGQKGLRQEGELLRDLIVIAKQMYSEDSEDKQLTVRKKKGPQNLSADTPHPYRIADLLKIIDDRLGLLDNKSEKPLLKFLKEKIESIITDIRFKFMFDQAICGGDRIEEVISKIFRVPTNDLPICVLEMSGLPSEVVASVASVLCRVAFEIALSSEGAIQTLVVCEEAHRYIPRDADAGFWPTRQAIGRIAKEGRKYGVYLGIITQRPGELDPTILSQCNTFFAMRLSNQKDQEIIEGAFSGGAQSTISFLPSIANRECIAFGEGLHSPMRMTFETVAAKDLPGANIRENQEAVRAGKLINLQTVIRHMRKQNDYQTLGGDDREIASIEQTSGSEQRPSQPAPQKSVVPGYQPNAADMPAQTSVQTPIQAPVQAPSIQTPQHAPVPNGAATPAPQPALQPAAAQSGFAHQPTAQPAASTIPRQFTDQKASMRQSAQPAPAKPRTNGGNNLIGSLRGNTKK